MVVVAAEEDMRLLLMCPTAAVDIALGVYLIRWTLVGWRDGQKGNVK